MRRQALRQSHLWAGAAGILIGGLAVFEAWDYPMGSLTRMGAGYFPIILGVALVVLSVLVLIFEGRAALGPDIPRSSWRGLLWVPLAVSAFAILVERLGLVPAIIAAVVLSSFADDDLTWRETVILALSVAAVCSVVFIYLLGLPLVPIRAW